MTTAAELAAALPESQRPAGERLIAQRILPRAIAEAPDQPGYEDRIRARVAERLATTAPALRLDSLQALAGEIELENLNRAAVTLAIARFLRDGHDVAAPGRDWITPEIERLRQGPLEDIEEQAALHEETLARWQRWAQAEQPSVWTGYRTVALHARTALASARTGSFETSSGALHDFLADAGAPTEHFDVF